MYLDGVGGRCDGLPAAALLHRKRFPDQHVNLGPEAPATIRRTIGAANRDRHDGRTGPGGQPAGTGEDGLDIPGAAGALREDPDRTARLAAETAPAATVAGPERRGPARTARR